ncbi:hypothetical protein RAS1_43400 [Phycisphaerae bacterium RAS1]|nr:hypothetical protein RAS1_43400 [Phycisphaerae bacterium RAS1]
MRHARMMIVCGLASCCVSSVAYAQGSSICYTEVPEDGWCMFLIDPLSATSCTCVPQSNCLPRHWILQPHFYTAPTECETVMVEWECGQLITCDCALPPWLCCQVDGDCLVSSAPPLIINRKVRLETFEPCGTGSSCILP